ncbi:hypothetical protein AVEN_182943-1, partial [Araneus ventricosus]
EFQVRKLEEGLSSHETSSPSSSGLVVRSLFLYRGAPESTKHNTTPYSCTYNLKVPESTVDTPGTLNLTLVKRPSAGVVHKFGDGMISSRVLSFSSDQDSKLRSLPKIIFIVLRNGSVM